MASLSYMKLANKDPLLDPLSLLQLAVSWQQHGDQEEDYSFVPGMSLEELCLTG